MGFFWDYLYIYACARAYRRRDADVESSRKSAKKKSQNTRLHFLHPTFHVETNDFRHAVG
nr:MAG TPA: hypothetical protein [Caudoviricetes sp.]